MVNDSNGSLVLHPGTPWNQSTFWTQDFNDSNLVLSDFDGIIEAWKQSLITLNQPNTIVLIALYVPVFLTAIIGNLTVLFVIIPNRRMWSVTNNFLLNLAIADLLGKSTFSKVKQGIKYNTVG